MPFRKGQSGNPKGRKPNAVPPPDAVREYMRNLGVDPLKNIAELANHSPDDKVRLQANSLLADRMYGKAANAPDDSSTPEQRGELARLSVEHRRLEVAKLRREVEIAADGATNEPLEIVVKMYPADGE